jgi:hypothetical protein
MGDGAAAAVRQWEEVRKRAKSHPDTIKNPKINKVPAFRLVAGFQSSRANLRFRLRRSFTMPSPYLHEQGPFQADP